MTPSPARETDKKIRPPIVVVVGHVDHGKTSILDWYRKTKIAEKESGGITQHIAAYEVEQDGKKLTFIDTPGHEAFPQIRVRGATIADIAILVVAADEGVKAQTREAIAVIRQSKIPFVVALNKTDKPGANPERIKQELAKEEVLVEGYGGQVPAVEISAKTGERMDELLETVLLVAEMESLHTDTAMPTHGLVLEAGRTSTRGSSATMLILNGVLKKSDVLVIGKSVEPIKILENFLGRSISEAYASSPVIVAGLSRVPAAGDTCTAFPDKKSAEEFAASLPAPDSGAAIKHPSVSPAPDNADAPPKPVFNVIIKADAQGSREALESEAQKLATENVAIKILKSEVGDINESDVKLAAATGLVTIAGFRVRTDSSVRETARHAHIRILTGTVIYELLNALKKEITELVPAEKKRIILGRIKILKLFKKDNGGQIVGGRVEEGVVRRGADAQISRNGEEIGGGAIAQVQREKTPADEAGAGAECGLLVQTKISIQPGDILTVFQEE
mgnify:FL=1